VSDIYPAGEAPIPGISGESLAAGIGRHGHHGVRYLGDKAQLVSEVARVARPGDVVIALGAGDINKILPQVEKAINARAGGPEGGS
jgi:UDP-N-acetylmuramate--alanine ligase